MFSRLQLTIPAKKSTCRLGIALLLGAFVPLLLLTVWHFVAIDRPHEKEGRNLTDPHLQATRTRHAISEILDNVHSHHRTQGRIPDPSDLPDSSRMIDGWGSQLFVERVKSQGRVFFKVQSSGPNTVHGDSDDIVRWYPIHPDIVDYDNK